jgi:hypothetical protein
MKLHVHVWNASQDDILSEANFEHTGTYDDHIQFSGMINGVHHEVRLEFDDIPEVVRAALNYGKEI